MYCQGNVLSFPSSGTIKENSCPIIFPSSEDTSIFSGPKRMSKVIKETPFTYLDSNSL